MRALEIDRSVLELILRVAHELLGVLVAKSSNMLIHGCSGLVTGQIGAPQAQ